MMVSFYFYIILPSSIFLAVPIVSASGLSLISILELIFYFVNFFRSHFLFLFQYSLHFCCNRASTRFAPIFFLMSKFFVLIISPRKKGLRYSGTILHTKKKFSLSFAGFFVNAILIVLWGWVRIIEFSRPQSRRCTWDLRILVMSGEWWIIKVMMNEFYFGSTGMKVEWKYRLFKDWGSWFYCLWGIITGWSSRFFLFYE